MSRLQRPPHRPPKSPPPPSPTMKTPTLSATPSPHPSNFSPPHFTWQYIWSFFIRAPRVRAWLFQRDPPPQFQVVQSLLSSPLLIGYVFAASKEHPSRYTFPDIGDLQTVFCRDGDALLGFHFGFQGLNPIMPLLFQVMRDPMLGNPHVVVRRTAKQRAPYPYHNYYLVIEFNWLESGALGVVTSVTPIDQPQAPSRLYPFISHGDHRVFNRRTAANLSAIADSLAQKVDLAYFPHPSHFLDLPQDFLDPPDDYYKLTVTEPDDPVHDTLVEPPHVRAQHREQVFQVEKEFPMSTTYSTTTTSTSHTSNTASTNNSCNSSTPNSAQRANNYPCGGAALQCTNADVTSVAEAGTVKLWKHWQDQVSQSRRTGFILTMLTKKIGGRFAKEVKLYGRESRYMFLSTSGINVHGRIQRLCSQLNIEFGSPIPDQLLLSTPANEEGTDTVKTESKLENAIDLTVGGLCTKMSWEQRMAGGVDGRSMATTTDYATHDWIRDETGASAGVQRTGNGVRSSSVSSDRTMNTADEQRVFGIDGTRTRKRRRTADAADITGVSPSPQDAALLASAGQSERANGLAAFDASTRKSTLPAPPKQEEISSDSGQRRSFHLTNILSDGVLSGTNNHEHSSDGVESSAAASSFNPSSGTKFTGETGTSALETEDRKPVVSVVDEKEGDGPGKHKTMKTVWTCDRCGQQIRGKKGNLNRHIANKHENIRAFACTKPNCGRKFQTRLNLVRHEQAVHVGRPFTCPSCPRAFKTQDDLDAHVRSAHEEADLKLECEICGNCFGRRSTLNRHMAKVHKPKREGAPIST